MKKISCFLILLLLCATSYGQTWRLITPKPGGLTGSAISFTIGNKVYAGGGVMDKLFFEYDPLKDTWTQKADIPGVDTNRTSAIAFSIGGKGYVGLGYDNFIDWVYKTDLWEYDPITDTWTKKADYPLLGRADAGVFVLNNKAYIAGGGNYFIPGRAIDSLHVFSDMLAYDPVTDTWEAKTKLPTARQGAAMFSIGQYGYLMGGTGASPNYDDLSDFYQYDPALDKWNILPNFKGGIRDHSIAFVIDGKGYVGFGADAASATSNLFADMYSYDPVANSWSNELTLPATGRVSSTATVVGNKAYIGNGIGATFLGDWWVYTAKKSSVLDTKINSTNISFYPQPAANEIHFTNLKADRKYEVRIFDIIGKLQSHVVISSVDQALDISELLPGVYSVILSNGTELVTLSFVKK